VSIPEFNKILVAGGNSGSGHSFSSVELITLSRSKGDTDCIQPPDLPFPSSHGGAAIIEDRMYICGGYNDQTEETLSDCLMYDSGSNEWIDVSISKEPFI